MWQGTWTAPIKTRDFTRWTEAARSWTRLNSSSNKDASERRKEARHFLAYQDALQQDVSRHSLELNSIAQAASAKVADIIMQS